METLTREDIEAIAIGAAILGTGGGGNPTIGKLRCFEELKRGRRIRIVRLDELADDASVVAVGGMGAPVIGIEKLREGEECLRAVRALEALGGRPADAIIAFEIGGATRETALAEAEAAAREKALAAGAIPETLAVVDREDVPLAYLPGNATRVRVKVVGEMRV